MRIGRDSRDRLTAALGAGGMMVGKTVTRRLLTAVFRRIATKIVAKQAAKVGAWVGDTVTVAGRITMGSGQLHRNWTEVVLQDATGGIKLVASSASALR